ncbi:MAG TPA: sulfite exporter TauE/SafE family protein [Candidatus Saccharimonadales bacterium]|nr:sulfite exporter TauE/SafE family protein [Candidatus Saccharimonadales bacterium]
MELVVLTFFVSLFASILSGISGGGGAFILTPYYIFIGLSPQQAVATGKVGGLGVAGGSLIAFGGKGFVRKELLLPLMLITVCTSFLAAWLMPQVNAGIFQTIIGILLIAAIPTLFINKASLQPGKRSGRLIGAGFVLYIVISLVQGIFGAGLAVLLTLNLMLFFGLGALEANATKRVAQSVQSVLLFILLLLQGLVVIGHGIAAFLGSFIGSHVGSKLAIKKGDKFVKVVLAITMVISGVALIAMAS